MDVQTGGGDRTGADRNRTKTVRRLMAAIRNEYDGQLPAWMMDRIEAKVVAKQEVEPTKRKSLRVKRRKPRES